MSLTVGFLVSKDRGGGKLVLWDSVSLDRLAPIRGFCPSGACYSNLRVQMVQKLCDYPHPGSQYQAKLTVTKVIYVYHFRWYENENIFKHKRRLLLFFVHKSCDVFFC